MPSPIVRALLYKEALRYRYNWGLFVVVGGLLMLAGLVSIGSRVRPLAAGQAAAEVDRCVVYASDASPDGAAWVAHLRSHPPSPPHQVEFADRRPVRDGAPPALRPGTVAIELIAPPRGDTARAWQARYWHPAEPSAAILPYRDWLARETRRFLRAEPPFEEETRVVVASSAPPDRSATMITALAVFALYLPAFTLYVASTGDEREKRLLLALLLTPATAARVVAAKAIFYVSISVSLAIAVVGIYDPTRLLNPLLWSTFLLGALTYVAMGTIAIGVIKRQATLGSVSMLYLLTTSSILILSGYLPLFGLLRLLFVEDYIYRQMQLIFAGRMPWWALLNQGALLSIALVWCSAAVVVVRRQGMALARPF